MGDEVYEEAKRRREALKRELAETEEFLQLYERMERRLKSPSAEVEKGEKQGSAPSTFGDMVRLPAVRYRRSPPRNTIAQMAREFLLEKSAPMTRGELVDAFDDANMPISGKDKSKNMGTIMWRMSEQFVNIEGHGYWPRDVACEKVGYDPEDPNSPEAISDTLDLDGPPKD